ncbi:MAG: shikimate kinase [Chitinophagales bacterium]|nr:shikimate kinase [Chitinophagales bacterium]
MTVVQPFTNYYLIGMPGSGKTTLGRQAAQQLNMQFVDLDKEIESNEQRTIADIFEQDGEVYFRKLESEYLERIKSISQSKIVATGGGTPCFHHNMQVMLQSGVTVFLDVPPSLLVERLNAVAPVRPLLKSGTEHDLWQKLENMYYQRKPYYEKAIYQLTGEEVSLANLIKLIQSTI